MKYTHFEDMNGDIHEIEGYEERLRSEFKQSLVLLLGMTVGGLLMCLI
jgi:hypothetical protein